MQCAVDVDHRRQLALDDLLGLPGFALGQRLADADDRRHAVRQRGLAFSATSASLSPWYCAPLGVADDGVAARRTRAASPPTPRRCRRPARAPRQSCAPSAIGAARDAAPATCARYGAGTQTATSQAGGADACSSACSSASLAARLPFIFQLPAISFVAVVVARAHQVSTILPMCWFDSISACASRRPPPAGRCCGSPA